MRPMAPSAMPCLVGERLAPAPVVLRVFLLRDANGNWRAMQGGLAHVLADTGEQGIAGPPTRRGAAKDVSVLAEDSTDNCSALALTHVQPFHPPLLRELPSRVADGAGPGSGVTSNDWNSFSRRV